MLTDTVRKHPNRPSTAAHYTRYMQNVWYSMSIAGDAPVQQVKDGTRCDTCRSTECVSHWRAGMVALILFPFLMSNIKFETLMQPWGNAGQRCRMIISDAPAWCCPERTSLSIPPTPDGSASVRSSADLKTKTQTKKHPMRCSWTRRSLTAATSVWSDSLSIHFREWFKFSSLRVRLCLAPQL